MLEGRAGDRSAFLNALDTSLTRDPRAVAVVRVDLDRFSRIGQTFGPAVARTVRSVLESRMLTVAGSPDRLMRYGTDSFVAIVTLDDVDPDSLETAGMDIVDLISSPIDIAGENIAVGSNVGIAAAAHFPEVDALRVLTAAELAVQRADALGSRRVIVYDVAPRNDPTRLPQLFADMLPAIAAGQFITFFQPIIRLDDQSICSAEALVRWDHPKHGLIPPSEFLHEAETSGLIRQIDANVRQAACAACATWPVHLDVAVNLSPADLDSPSLLDSVATILTTTGLAPQRLVLEVTETAMSQDWPRARRRLEALKVLGVRLAVDDFGSGHMYLDRLIVGIFDILKLDRSVIALQEDNPSRHRALLTSITRMAQTLDLEVLAEGVETVEHLDRVLEAGCTMAQGHLFAPAQSGRDFARMTEPPPPDQSGGM